LPVNLLFAKSYEVFRGSPKKPISPLLIFLRGLVESVLALALRGAVVFLQANGIRGRRKFIQQIMVLMNLWFGT
jgi:hypothetical protein